MGAAPREGSVPGARLPPLLRRVAGIGRGWTFLARSHWGGVYNGELKRLMRRHALRSLRSVVFYVSPGNLRSQRAMAKIGGIREPQHDSAERLVFRIRSVGP